MENIRPLLRDKRQYPPKELHNIRATHIAPQAPTTKNPNYPANTPITLTGPMMCNPHTPTQEHPCSHKELANIAPRQNLTFPPHKSKTHRQIGTKTFCKKIKTNKHPIPPTPASRNMHTPHTLTNPNYQPKIPIKIPIEIPIKRKSCG